MKLSSLLLRVEPPLANVAFRDPYQYKLKNETFIPSEGIYTIQFVYCGKKANLQVGNIIHYSICKQGAGWY